MKKLICLLLSVVMLMAFFPCFASAQITADGLVYRIDDDETVAVIGYHGTATHVTIPATLENLPVLSIENEAFFDCSELVSVTLPDGLLTIHENVFGYCTSLERMIIPDSVVSIGKNAFGHCDKLSTVTVGKSVESIGLLAFSWCPSLSSFSVNQENQHFSTVDGILTNKEQTKTIIFPEGKVETEYILPKGITTIGAYSFFSADKLTELTLTEDVTTMEDYAFFDCDCLYEVYVLNQQAKMEEHTFNPIFVYALFGYNGSSSQMYATVQNIRFESLGDGSDDLRTTGDINADGETNAADALLALQCGVNKIELSLFQLFLADVDVNQQVNAVDALIILQKSLAKETVTFF